MNHTASRLLSATSLAVVGDAAAAARVIEANRAIGFSGPIWPVHPNLQTVAGLPAVAGVHDLAQAPDAAFVAVPARACPEVVADLAAIGCGGVVVYSSGFAEHPGQVDDLQQRLVNAAGSMPLLGPNCYGLVNYADAVAIWPDQHGGLVLSAAERGVSVVSQSSSIAISVTMQNIGLPLSHVVTVGNAAALSPAAIGAALIDTAKVSALGLIVESLADVRGFEVLAARSRQAGVAVVALVLGHSEQARRVVASHSASLASDAALASGFLSRLGIGEVGCVDELLATLGLLHCGGPLPGASLASLSSSGGEAALIADTAARSTSHPLIQPRFDPLDGAHRVGLAAALGERVPLDNPLDYHTYAWADRAAMVEVFTAMLSGPADLTLLFADLPRRDRCRPDDWLIAVDAFDDACRATGSRGALVAAMAANLSGADARDLVARGLAVLAPPSVAMAAVRAAATTGVSWARPPAEPVLPASPVPARVRVLDEADAKRLLARHGIRVPAGGPCHTLDEVRARAAAAGWPVVVKALGPAHKSDVGGVVLGLTDPNAAARAAAPLLERFGGVLVEQQAGGVELLVAVDPDPVFGPVLTIGSGGVLTEMLGDVAQLVLPVTDTDLVEALDGLRVGRLLRGYRGAAAADLNAVVGSVQALVGVVAAGVVTSVEVNPLLAGPHGAFAVDALVSVPELVCEPEPTGT
jgi:acyl-CoA synthetase (NDP forming)